MNLKQVISLLVLVALLGGVGLVIHNKGKAAWDKSPSAMGKSLLDDFPVNNVTRIAIKQGTNELNLVKKDDLWRVQERHEYPANFSQISEFLLKVRDLKIVQTEKVGASQLSRLHLAAGPGGTNPPVTLEFKGPADQLMRSLLLGKAHLKKTARSPQMGDEEGFPDGRYVKVSGSEDVAVISDPLEMVQAKPEEWLNKDFFKVEKVTTLEVVFPVATNSWKLTRETPFAAWTLAEAKPDEKLDPAKTIGDANPLGSAAFTDVLLGGKLEGSGTNTPVQVKIATSDHFNYSMLIGQKTNEDYWVTIAVSAQFPKERETAKDEKPEIKAKLDEAFQAEQQKLKEKLKQEQVFANWTYLVPSWSLDSLLKERAQLMADKETPPNTDSEPSPITPSDPPEPKVEPTPMHQ